MDINYDKLAYSDNGCIRDVKKNLNYNCNYKTGHVIGLIFHTIRNSLTYAQSAEFITLLPNSLKIIYVKDWKIVRDFTPLDNLDDLINSVIRRDSKKVFTNEITAREQIIIALKTINRHIDLLANNCLRKCLKKDLSEILTETVKH